MATVGERIKQRRIEAGLRAEDVANKLDVSLSTLYRYENGDIEKVDLKVVEDLARILRTTPAYLMGWTKTEEYSIQTNNKAFNVEDMASNVMMFGGRELTDEKKKIIQSIIEGYLREAGD